MTATEGHGHPAVRGVPTVTHRAPDFSPRARRVLAAIVAAHGLAHCAGAAVNLALARHGGAAELLGGWWVTRDATVLTGAAAVWGALAVVMLLASGLVLAAAPAARAVLFTAATASLVVCAVSLWAAEAGVAINIGLLAAALTLDHGRREVAAQ
jgi:hypothetical protein